MKALSIRQPWAWLLIHGPKDIENRDWLTRYRGPVAIHAAKGMTREEWLNCVEFVMNFDRKLADSIPPPDNLVRGAVIGLMDLRDCTTNSSSPWFQGKYGFLLRDPEPRDPIYVKGALGLWEWDGPNKSKLDE